jgi:hypothetical protein
MTEDDPTDEISDIEARLSRRCHHAALAAA